MSANQPTQQTAATKFLIHTLFSFGVGLLLAVLTAIGQYVATAGDSIDIKIVISVGGAAFLAYLLSHFNKDIAPNEVQLLQGINDAVAQAVQQAHAPLYNAVGQLQQQVAQVAAQPAPQPVQQTPTNPMFPFIPQQPSVSQIPTQDMPAVIVSQPWQPPAPDIAFGDTGAVPIVSQ